MAHVGEFHRWTTALNVKLLLPPRQSRGASLGRLALGRSSHDSPAMISLTDEQLRTVMELAVPIPVECRDRFLRELAAELRLHGPGELHRLCVAVRRRSVPWTTALVAGIR